MSANRIRWAICDDDQQDRQRTAELVRKMPVEEEKPREALLYGSRRRSGCQDIALPTLRGIRRLRTDDMIYAEAWGRGVRITLRDGQEEAGLKISQLETMLPTDRFFLCHRTVLVNLEFVQYIRYGELVLKNGEVLPLSRYRQNEAREKLLRYLIC